jgi:hypothetical protein
VGERFRIATPETLIDVDDGHRVSANPALDRGVFVKAVSPLAGRSEAESLDNAEASAILATVMADGPRRSQAVKARASRGLLFHEIDRRDMCCVRPACSGSGPCGGAWNVLHMMSMVEESGLESHAGD